jgi:hypothetical protein
VTYALVAAGAFVLGIVVVANFMATVALIRTNGLTRFQKIAQGVIVWMLPFSLFRIGFRIRRLIGMCLNFPESTAKLLSALRSSERPGERSRARADANAARVGSINDMNDHSANLRGGGAKPAHQSDQFR